MRPESSPLRQISLLAFFALGAVVLHELGGRPPVREVLLVVILLMAAACVALTLALRRSAQEAASSEARARRAEEAAKLTEQKFQSGFRRASFGIVLVGLEGRILECNRAAQTLLGYSEAELKRLTIRDINHPDDGPRCMQQFQALVAGQYETHQDERRYVRKDGTIVHAVLRATAIRDEQGAFQFSLGLLEDLTDRKKLEAQLVASERLASIGTLAAGVAHEINNPLAFVLANLTYAIEELERQIPQAGEVAQALREAKDGASRVRDIVRDLKVFSRRDGEESGGADLCRVIESAVHLAQNEIRHRARLEVEVGKLPPVKGSEKRLGQVVLNLLVNAAQAIPDGHADENEIHVSAALEGDDHVVLQVRDSGVGIAPDLMSKIFDPFFTTKPVGVGTGLGLSICHGIVSSVGGTISVDSHRGEGSVFRVRLPVARGSTESDGEAPRSSDGRQGLRILVVDDEPLVGQAVRRLLGAAYHVEAVTDVRAALSRLGGAHEFDVVLCDVMMPEMNGLDLHAEIAKRSSWLASRVVFMTGGAFTRASRDSLQRLPNPCIDKPFDPDLLRSLLASFPRDGARS